MRNHGTIFAALVLCSLLISACSGSTTNKPQITTVISSSRLLETNRYPPRRIRYQCEAAECTKGNYPLVTPSNFKTTRAPNPKPGQTIPFEDHILTFKKPVYRYMTTSRYIATGVFSLPAKLHYGLGRLFSAAMGITKPPQGVLPPTTSWTGTAILRDLNLNNYSGIFNASFDGQFWDFSITNITSDSGATIKDYNWKRIGYSADTHKTAEYIASLLKGTVHGPNHESVAITFDDIGENLPGYGLAGVAVGHR